MFNSIIKVFSIFNEISDYYNYKCYWIAIFSNVCRVVKINYYYKIIKYITIFYWYINNSYLLFIVINGIVIFPRNISTN